MENLLSLRFGLLYLLVGILSKGIAVPLQSHNQYGNVRLQNDLENSRIQSIGIETNIDIHHKKYMSHSPPDKEQQELNYRPIIGILAQECQPYFREEICSTSYIAASYVKYIESAGARVVPVLIDQPEDYYRFIFNSTNGLLLPGGDVSLSGSGYARSGKLIFQMAIESDKYYPIWGTCMGLELLTYLTNEEHDPLTICKSSDQVANLLFTEKYSESRIGMASPEDVDQILSEQDVTINFHNWCLTPENFTKSEPLKSFWDVLSNNYDEQGLQFISMMEAKNYPIWAIIYHPEKNMFEWTEKYTHIPHTRDAVHIAAFEAEFFVEETRKNMNGFSSREEEEKHLIYNYTPEFTGSIEKGQTMIQCYFF